MRRCLSWPSPVLAPVDRERKEGESCESSAKFLCLSSFRQSGSRPAPVCTVCTLLSLQWLGGGQGTRQSWSGRRPAGHCRPAETRLETRPAIVPQLAQLVAQATHCHGHLVCEIRQAASYLSIILVQQLKSGLRVADLAGFRDEEPASARR